LASKQIGQTTGAISLTGPRALVADTPAWIGRHSVLGSVASAR
jgi:hypothetical protein